MKEAMVDVKKGTVAGMEAIEIVDAYSGPSSAIDSIVQDIIDKGGKELVFNCKRMSYMTSMGMGQLIKIIRQFKKIDGQIYLYGVREDIKQCLRDTSLEGYFKYL